MKQKIKLFSIFFILLLVVLLPNKVFGATTSRGGYEINTYYIEMVVNENNTFDITETITVNFTGSGLHGIFRKIPLQNTLQRNDGTTTNNVAKISGIKVNDSFTTYNESGNKVIKIGNKNRTVSGIKEYVIKYTYSIGKDPLKNVDELYYNLIGTDWDTNIHLVSFKIIMPKSFDYSSLGFTSGSKYSTDSSNVSYVVDGNVITGSVKRTLTPYEGLTVRLTLPEGYFVGAKNNFDYFIIFKIVVSLIFVGISYALWAKYGKDNMVIETLEFYPPNDLNSADLAFAYKGVSENKDIISLLIYLANKGYLKIEESEETALKFIKMKNFKIIKLKEYDGTNDAEREFFYGLFKDKTEVTRSDLYDKFYVVLNSITRKMNKKDNKEKLFEKESLGKRFIVVLMILALFVLCGGLSLLKTIGSGSIALMVWLLIMPISAVYARPNVGTIIAASISIPLLFIITLAANLSYSGMNFGLMSILYFIIEITCIVMLIIFLGIMRKRTQYGNEIYGRIKGFKKFLEEAEKPKLEELVMEDPEYFYNILPYTYALNVSNKWMKNFEDIALQAPSWYSGYNSFDNHEFTRFIDSTYNSISSAMSSSPSDSGSGGGSSGGGSGGGGGGSW